MTHPHRDALDVEELLAHQGWVRSLATSLVADPERAEDVAQKAWLTAMARPPGRRTAPAAWLARVVRSRAFDLFRSEARRAGREKLAARREDGLSPGELAEQADVCRILAEAVSALSPTGRDAVLLHYFHGLTRREVAERLSVPHETARRAASSAAPLIPWNQR